MTDPILRWHPRDGSPWDLGQAMCEVGPGWWPLLRDAFGEVEERGGIVTGVRQKGALLDVHAKCPGWSTDDQLALRRRYRRASASVCEACGGSLNEAAEVQDGGDGVFVRPRRWRTHCGACSARLKGLGYNERALWMDRSGRWLPEWGR